MLVPSTFILKEEMQLFQIKWYLHGPLKLIKHYYCQWCHDQTSEILPPLPVLPIFPYFKFEMSLLKSLPIIFRKYQHHLHFGAIHSEKLVPNNFKFILPPIIILLIVFIALVNNIISRNRV